MPPPVGTPGQQQPRRAEQTAANSPPDGSGARQHLRDAPPGHPPAWGWGCSGSKDKDSISHSTQTPVGQENHGSWRLEPNSSGTARLLVQSQPARSIAKKPRAWAPRRPALPLRYSFFPGMDIKTTLTNNASGDTNRRSLPFAWLHRPHAAATRGPLALAPPRVQEPLAHARPVPASFQV